MNTIHGCGLGLRREFLDEISAHGFLPDWWEITPENWIVMPYHRREKFELALHHRKAVAHGLSLSIGSTDALDVDFLKTLKTFFDRYGIEHYSEHLSYSALGGAQSYELLPLPMTEETIKRVAQKVKEVQERLERPLILENATYYYIPKSTMSEREFIGRVLEESGAKLLLDVNNVFVNSVNHSFDPYAFIDSLDAKHVSYIHVAGHYDDKESGLLIDTHGRAVREEVWKLLSYTLQKMDVPVMLERDNYVPTLAEIQIEYQHMKTLYTEVRRG
ncbi:MAG: DUF692 domain-containing protein [Sulfurospirillaceae bacterium]|jgi:uncharacterized protein (UPF0276 family)|nr:DUF692 domain-containing protein [Sulfurospirillaceae bacterium]MDD2826699.1 DUF692 domain-containing protein [Sulfurospirillaceae bacterium]